MATVSRCLARIADDTEAEVRYSVFIMASGMPTHASHTTGEPIAIETHVHLLSDHVTAGIAARWTLVEMKERVIDDVWLAVKPKWAPYRSHPIAVAFVWRKSA